MGQIRDVPLAALIAGILYADEGSVGRASQMLVCEFGPIEIVSPVFYFTMTDYYATEMGELLKKKFCCFSHPIHPESLPDIKLMTNRIESELAHDENEHLMRTVNIDPGYVTLSKLVLATTKDYSHRIFIGKGIFAETTLRYRDGKFTPIDITYPDYRTPLAIDFFNDVRDFVKRNRNLWNHQKE